MSIHVGIDVGAVSVKLAVTGPAERLAGSTGTGSFGGVPGFRLLSGAAPGVVLVLAEPRRARGRPIETARALLVDTLERLGIDEVSAVMVTGSGGLLVAEAMQVPRCNEFQAIARAAGFLTPQARTVFEIGGESSKYLRLSPESGDGRLSIVDYGSNGDCAAGTGAFLDQQAGRLSYEVEDIGTVVERAERCAQIAGRCSVFAKSDMIHAQQKGFAPPEVLRGLCKAVAANYRLAVVKGRTPEPPVVFIGGVSANTAVVRELRELFGLDRTSLTVPDGADAFPAAGAALLSADGRSAGGLSVGRLAARLEEAGLRAAGFATLPPLTLDRVQILRHQVRPYVFPEDDGNGDGDSRGDRRVDAFLGIDIGSVGTKLAVIDERGDVIHSIFTRTEGRPIEVVGRILRELEEAVGGRIRIRAVGTTGSGRELIGELVGADAITDEITCHKTGAAFVGDRLLGRRPDTIFEIGGQDSKYISLQPEGDGSGETVVVDFTMNEACAAGTGSFLEERAEELGVSIRGEFARLAMSSSAPLRLGERCTVFMERDVNTAMQRGARREDVIAGLAYSVACNYINRVVRGRPIGECVFFQGGTAYNDAVAAAFSAIIDRPVIVPPHNAVLGAIGAALVAREKVAATGGQTRFRGYHIEEVDYTLREFACKGCGNLCAVQEFTVEGEKTYWGDKCSDRYRKRSRVRRKASIPDLIELRRELLAADDRGDPPDATRTIGVPMAMYTWDMLPLWRTFLRGCGFGVAVSGETSRRTVRLGMDCVVAEPCFPIIVAHGHVAELVERRVDAIWLPNLLSARMKPCAEDVSHVCPWGQTLPFVVRQAPAFRDWQGRILCPTLRFRDGPAIVRERLVEAMRSMGVGPAVAGRAFDRAVEAWTAFRAAYQQAGREAVELLDRTGEPGMVLVGRPYNIHDAGVSLAVARKLRDHYAVNVLPVDALPVDDIDVSDINDNMFWEYGRRILAAARFVAGRPNLHLIYVTNFKCGPDSFIKAFVRDASGKPFLTLQFDGHSNDAGMMTRCEAYLDSKGILRWWRKCEAPPETRPSKAGPSTSPRWPTPVPG